MRTITDIGRLLTCRPGHSHRGVRHLLVTMLLIAICGAASPTLAISHDRTDITADNIRFNYRDGSLVAEGNVMFIQEDWQIHTSRFLYSDDVITLEEPIFISSDSGVLMRAKQAEIDRNTMARILTGVRILLEDQVQLASGNYIEDEDGNVYIRDVIVTGCQICSIDERPVWHFKADSMIIPNASERAYLKNPALVVGGTQIGGVPWLSVPAPGIYRASGFLFPEISYSNSAGLGLQMPYFMTIGDHAGLTLSPGITSRRLMALGYQYQQRFSVGRLDIEGVANRSEKDESYIKETIDVDSDWRFSQTLTATALHSSLLDGDHLHYGGVYSGLDDVSAGTLTFRDRGTLLSFEAVKINPEVYVKSDYKDEIEEIDENAEIDKDKRRNEFVRDRISEYDNRLKRLHGLDFRQHVYGEGLPFDITLRGWFRESRLSTLDEVNKADGDNEVSFPNLKSGELPVRRYGLSAEVSRQEILPSGVVGKFSVLGKVDRLRWQWHEKGKQDDETDPPKLVKRTSRLNDLVAAVDLSLPMSRQAGDGVQVLEPFVQLVYAKPREFDTPDLPQPDLELDAGNIRSIDRFANDGLREKGWRVNLGTRLSSYQSNGNRLALTVGMVHRGKLDRRVAKETGKGGMSGGSSMPTETDGEFKDYLERNELVFGVDYRTAGGLSLNQTVHYSKGRKIRSAQSIIGYADGGMQASVAAAWSRQDPDRDGLWGYNLAFDRKISRNVTLGLSHDVGSERESEYVTGLSLLYQHQCASIIAGAERIGHRGSDVKADLKFSLSMRLAGFQTATVDGQDSCG